MKKILYFYSVASPWSYLGIKRLKEISKKYSAQIIEKPIDLVGKVFVATGGTPVPQRHISRQNYRLLELKRWGEFLNIKINQKPKFFPPKDPHLPALFCLASIDMGINMDFSSKVLEHLWVKENDISNIDTLKLIADDLKISFEELNKLATSDKIKKIYEANTQEAINMNIFGVPSYVYNNEIFWGQDRLELLEYSLKKN
ncbi:MAG: 2-hydroxychromene-2-carboxylate isomerase [Candidatus Fonsibacter ubiquis]|jgi:2-hydroxychromene-2-carboxylate isomerase|uniref:2-hydroxychromene-2-carboxylate isomerase n=1 Tax=Candidatus Fonsibacter ubiquis TaxID=1925548 RepID=UPI000C06896E|nr:2-hydroxychromene-2-carboxylate isomerase [Candidatus Fonsibacter ubiquis]MBU6306044.1 2-hydroxychromene-2-carboxylate isomerase [Pseudomonadota bacterium]NCU52176.1 2-hydroxychromene-2-carboxylate isomerase [Candidatus Fonsibacter ubiquis]NCU73091.1 2-hydroxychromene-2-carboxylate isomerase [Candidatus Fonsibacter ubiquis]NDD06090.1 2-hydroxychromene-2-carboxylate isomerase [Pseudomonadota bacterium]